MIIQVGPAKDTAALELIVTLKCSAIAMKTDRIHGKEQN